MSVVQQEPIAAIATAVGESAIAIVRMSGAGVLNIADKVFRKAGKKPFSFLNAPSHTAHYGYVVDSRGEWVDEAMAIVYRSPRSFTMEDVVEFNCHGGVVATQTVLETLLDAGCRLAQAGEFTRRAFLNGRIDLVQAEAIGEMIHAKTHAAYRAALAHLKGDLSKKLSALRDDLLNACAMLELELDFSEEDVEFQSRDELRAKMRELKSNLIELADSFKLGKLVQEGAKTAIVGKPNAGKSTLLNALLGKERAIVSDVAGTTRDYIEESFAIDGVLFKLIDTAGLRPTLDQIESEGIRRSYEKIEEADLILYLVDASTPVDADEINAIRALKERNPDAKFLLALNKIDKGVKAELSLADIETVKISALAREGIADLKRKMKALALGAATLSEGSLMLTSLRHYEAIRNALQSLEQAETQLRLNAPTELIAFDLRDALNHIGAITGQVTTDDVLNLIFSRFCIGK
ncbi:MAG: tRNA uridine-5-carboxymethylaminomethyl(34) synthesis GTPase MnmE [Chloroherpetonaceae bacterium]|nr:tRNA uridine-5-carboxymethylaminomethyl(34) synthesis GTPase MnmE [Chloroherpetonaceae bacterium]MDW8436982.1 tRNA uridine-5-carboxymethylaminomethyl(34) synthesis GTPase MnmE [Chloroherpetonaceae bacterium]